MRNRTVRLTLALVVLAASPALLSGRAHAAGEIYSLSLEA
jgi:hypothetical protein